MPRSVHLRARFVLGLAALLCAGGCEASRQAEAERREGDRVLVAKRYQELAFLAELAADGDREVVSCDDASLPEHLRRSGRSCKRLHAVDVAYARHLFGGRSVDAAERDRWQWQRTLAFDELVPLADAKDRITERKLVTRLAELDRSYVAVFTASRAPVAHRPQRYQGWLVIVDVAQKKLRCQIDLDLDVAALYAVGNDRDDEHRLFLAADRRLAEITKNFCLE